MTISRMGMAVVLDDIISERERQDAKWGQQDLPDGTGGFGLRSEADLARRHCDLMAKMGHVTYRHILAEEVAEALAEADKAKLRAELVQVAAVAVQWIEKLDREAKAVQP